MKHLFVGLSLLLISASTSFSQLRFEGGSKLPLTVQVPSFKIQARSYVFLIGVQRGKYTFIELGAEKHWTKVRLVHQRTYALGGNLEYNFGKNVIGYKISAWTKTGRLNFTYGLNLCYFTDFDHSRYGAGPAIGFRLLGFHLINGYNFTLGDSELTNYNKLYITLRYNFPLDKKIRFRKSKK